MITIQSIYVIIANILKFSFGDSKYYEKILKWLLGNDILKSNWGYLKNKRWLFLDMNKCPNVYNGLIDVWYEVWDLSEV